MVTSAVAVIPCHLWGAHGRPGKQESQNVWGWSGFRHHSRHICARLPRAHLHEQDMLPWAGSFGRSWYATALKTELYA
eukprot:2709034-Amphidinium_carterae.1